jgi:hypothetical protein
MFLLRLPEDRHETGALPGRDLRNAGAMGREAWMRERVIWFVLGAAVASVFWLALLKLSG